MSVSGSSYGPSNVAFDAIDDFLFYWAYALLFLSICLLVRKRQLLTYKASDLNPPRKQVSMNYATTRLFSEPAASLLGAPCAGLVASLLSAYDRKPSLLLTVRPRPKPGPGTSPS